MRIWIEEYGRVTVAVLCCLCLCALLFSAFLSRWRENGGVRDSIKTNFNSDEAKRTPPVLHLTDFKVQKGKEVSFLPYVSAEDFDGTDLTGQIEMSEETPEQSDGEGTAYRNMLTDWNGKIWERQGVFRFILRVKSAVTGKVTKGKLIVLVDFPANNEGREGR
ncbi:MAG: hypothetical protein NC293_10900 [Roseburia sp.]|nr:hypothetical protein [Roseburia sp.]